jgi:hypothetical protein
MSEITFLPQQAMNRISDGDEFVDAVDSYDPEIEFVFSVSIGQENDPELEVLRNTFKVPYIGEKEEEARNKDTWTIAELRDRFDKKENKKSMRCDWCNQRRKRINLQPDSVCGKLIFCNQKCEDKAFDPGNGSNHRKVAEWYTENMTKFGQADGSLNFGVSLEK